MSRPLHTRRFVPVLASLLFAGAAFAPVASTQERSSEFETMRTRFEGTWILAVPQARARQTVDRAIDRAVNAMSFFMRPIARPMIRDNTPVNRQITLAFLSNNRIRVTFDTGATYTTTVGRPARGETLEGDPMTVTQRFRDGTLEQVFQADQGTRWNVYTSTGEGRLRIAATTSADMMPRPLVFQLDYRRR